MKPTQMVVYGEEGPGPWLSIAEQCDYCAERWAAVIHAADTRLQEGLVCPACGIQNKPHSLDVTDCRKTPTPAA